MAILAYDDVMLREPRLLARKSLPISICRADLTHPLSVGLVLCALPACRADVATMSPLGSLQASGSYAGSPEGMVCESTSTTAGGIAAVYKPQWQRMASVYQTILVRARVDAWGSYGKLMSIPFSTSAWTSPYHSLALGVGASGSTPTYSFNSGGSLLNVSGSGSWGTDTVPANYAFTRAGIYGTGIFYKDKNTFGTAIDTSSGTPIITANANMGILNSSPYNPTGGVDGVVAMVCVWNRALSPAEIGSLADDPYQFLIPA